MYFTLKDLGGPDKSDEEPMGYVEPSPPNIDCIDFVTDAEFFTDLENLTGNPGFSIRDGHIRFNSIWRNSGEIIDSLKEGGELLEYFARLHAALRADQEVMAACRRVSSFLSGLRQVGPEPDA
jgi:hypothetical protein